MNRGEPLLKRLLKFASPDAVVGAHPIHGLHPYPAKYIPQLPREVILEHTNERHTVLDPFCGSGTTLVEAAILGRKSIGIDSNPIACLITQAKTTPLSKTEIEETGKFLRMIRSTDPRRIPDFRGKIIERQEHWFQPNMLRELAWLNERVHQVESLPIRTFLSCVLSSVVNAVSRQDSETRYKAVDKNLPDGYALSRFIRKLAQSVSVIRSYSELHTVWRNIPTVHHASADRVGKSVLPDHSVDLIVTSPPYPNSFDYYLYHKLRMALLGYDARIVQQREIGSRYEHSSRRAPIAVFVERMRPVMANLGRLLKPSKLAYFFVGDSVVGGRHIDMSAVYADLAREAGFWPVGETHYDLAEVSRSFQDTRGVAGNSHGHQKMQRVLVFESRRTSRTTSPASRAIAVPVASQRPRALEGEIPDGSVVALESNDQDRHVHSLVSFPSKFIPDIPRWAVTMFARRGETVLDPFAGSGTTAVEALLAGRNSIAVDVNPYASLVTTAKTTRVSIKALDSAADRLLSALAKPSRLPKAERLTFELDDFWFNPSHLMEFARIHEFILSEIPSPLQAFFRVVLATTIRDFSFQDRDQIKVKRDPKKVLQGTPPPRELLRKRLPGAVGRLEEFLGRLPQGVSSDVYARSAEDFAARTLGPDSVDLIVTSPPYINAMNYPMATRYELLLLGLVKPEALREHQMIYFGTERVYARDYGHMHQVPLTWSVANDLNARLAKVFELEPKRSFIAFDFFRRMHAALDSLVKALRRGGRFVMVAGTNTIRGVHIDTFRVLVSLLEDLGLTRDCVFHYEIIKQKFKITRHKTGAVIPHDGVAVLTQR